MEKQINNNPQNYETSLKSRDTEETIDMWFYRPLGYRWALLFQKLRITPNTVTWMGIILGVLAGICFYFDDIYINIIGMILLIWANTYDSADGQLARMTGIKTPLGRLLDGLCGDIWFIAIYTALVVRMTPQYGISIWILGAIAGYCHSRQAAMADYYRNVHLYFLKGKNGSELETSAQIRRRYQSLSYRRDPIYKIFDYFYISYTQAQEKATPSLLYLLAQLKQKYGEQIPEEIRQKYRQKSLPLIKYTNILSFNTRIIALYISLLLHIPWAYFVFELTILNAILIYMLIQYRKINAEITRQIQDEKNTQ